MRTHIDPSAAPRPRCPHSRSLEPLEPRLLLSSTPFELATLPAENGGDGSAGVMFYHGGYLRSVSSAGDLNGDGVDDLVYGGGGTVQVVFGQAGGYTGGLDLQALELDGTNGFTLVSDRIYDLAGESISPLGDINGDGYNDLLIGARGDADYSTVFDEFGPPTPGRGYVVLGKRGGFDPVIDLRKPDGQNLFQFVPRKGYSFVYAVNGVGDVNGDGLNDFAVATGRGRVGSGQTVSVVYGQTGKFPAILRGQDLDGTNGFVVSDSRSVNGFRSMKLASGVGDINGDGYDDIVYKPTDADQIHVVYGGPSGGPANWDFSDIDGGNGFAITAQFSRRVDSIAFAGDINGDGIDDLVIGVGASGVLGEEDPGEAHVIFGNRQGFGASFDASNIDGTNGFTLRGIGDDDRTGTAVSGVGDFNNDGFDDVLVAAPGADVRGHRSAGAAYLFYGTDSGFDPVFNLDQFIDQDGFIINGFHKLAQAGYQSGRAGDFNGDGRPDLMVRANGQIGSQREEVYIIWGGLPIEPQSGIGTGGSDVLIGTPGGDLLLGGDGDDLLVGKGGPDILVGGAGDDLIMVSDTGFTRIAGGEGNDTLFLNAVDAFLSLTGLNANNVSDIEVVDITGSGANALILNQRDIELVTGPSNTLTVKGNFVDTVYLGYGWSRIGSEVIGSDTFDIYEHDESPVTLKIVQTVLVEPAPPPLADGDFTGDGKADIVWHNTRDGSNAVWQLDDTAFELETRLRRLPNTDWTLVGTGDFTGDGKNDILWRNTKDGRNRLWEMNHTEFVQRIDLKTMHSLDWQVAGVGDFTEDGRNDILWRNTRNGRNAAWEMAGTEHLGAISLKSLKNQDWQAAAVGDLTGDGRDDILWRNRRTGKNTVWKMSGSEFQRGFAVKEMKNPAWQIAGIADYTGDGKNDILWRHTTRGLNSVWEMNKFRFVDGIPLSPLLDLNQQPASPLLGLWER